ncbi:MAG: MarR family transcriptional regulator [Paludibacteraceae bacterium]|nr:MarR family transcriptional regulator [Paludibacteraceae bacterium]
MLLSKEVAVCMDLAVCKFKQFSAQMLKANGVNLTPEQFLLVDLLWNEGPMTQQQIADAMHKDKNSVTKFIDSLERKNMVERLRGHIDRRSNLIRLTEKAQELKVHAKEKGISTLDHILDGISEEELRQFLATLNKMTENMVVKKD